MTAPNVCVIVPVYNHDRTVKQVVEGARAVRPVIVVDDGSTDRTAEVLDTIPDVARITLSPNQGKAAALRAGFARAREDGFTHAITIDADGQHPVEALPDFVWACRQAPEAFIIGVRDLKAAGAPPARLFSNWLSTITFKMETRVHLNDTQCGYRCYPLALLDQLQVGSRRYAYELEVMVRAAWAGTTIEPLPVGTDYRAPTSRLSHFRPFVDFMRIFLLHARLSTQAFCVPALLRRQLALKSFHAVPRGRRIRTVLRHVFSEHARTPGKLALSVGLGFFCGIAPIWGAQMLAAAFLAHVARLNKAIALAASNISFPLAAPFILAAALQLGHFIYTGHWADFTPDNALEQIPAYLWYWFVGSVVLASAVAGVGTVGTYLVARLLMSSPQPGNSGGSSGSVPSGVDRPPLR